MFFDVGLSASDRASLEKSVRVRAERRARNRFLAVYGRSEEVIGDLATKLGIGSPLFLATKVWTTGKRAGTESMERIVCAPANERIDLMRCTI